MTKRLPCLLLVVGVLLLVRSASAAQTVTATTGAVNGIVTDSSQAVVPGVTITLSGPALITPRTTLTDDTGAYRFSAVPPGDHTLTFDLAGFVTIVREGIQIGLGFTATVNVEMSPGNIRDSVSVRGSPVVDVSSTAVTTHFDDDKLATLPGSRDIFSVLANTPGVAQPKMDVGGNGALALQDYTAYGLRSVLGVHRNEVEGIRVGGANGSSDNYLSDYASFAEIAITAVGNSAAMPDPGILARYVSKSGGNAFHGNVYADFQNDGMEATNIDNDQIRRGVTGGPGLPARDVNKLQRFRDFTIDAGGYLKKDKAWWYGAYRSSSVTQRYPWLLDTAATLDAEVVTGKATVPPVSPASARRLHAARGVSAVEFLCRRREPAAPDERCVAQPRFPRERVERRIQRRRDRRALRRSQSRRLSLRRSRHVQERGATHCGCRQRTRSVAARGGWSGSSTDHRSTAP